MSFISYNSGNEESSAESDNDFKMEIIDNVKPAAKKPSISKKKKDNKINKNEKKTKTKKNTSYIENIDKLIKNEIINVDILNSITVKQGDNIINVKSTSDNKCTDYWTLSHYKTENIKNIDVKDRWKKAECSLKLAITDEPIDHELSNNLSEIVQSVFTRFMSDPKRKISRSKMPKS